MSNPPPTWSQLNVEEREERLLNEIERRFKELGQDPDIRTRRTLGILLVTGLRLLRDQLVAAPPDGPKLPDASVEFRVPVHFNWERRQPGTTPIRAEETLEEGTAESAILDRLTELLVTDGLMALTWGCAVSLQDGQLLVPRSVEGAMARLSRAKREACRAQLGMPFTLGTTPREFLGETYGAFEADARRRYSEEPDVLQTVLEGLDSSGFPPLKIQVEHGAIIADASVHLAVLPLLLDEAKREASFVARFGVRIRTTPAPAAQPATMAPVDPAAWNAETIQGVFRSIERGISLVLTGDLPDLGARAPRDASAWADRIPNAFAGGFASIPNNPVIKSMLWSIFHGGAATLRSRGGWRVNEEAGDLRMLLPVPGLKGQLDVRVAPADRDRDQSDPRASSEAIVRALDPFDARAALAALAQFGITKDEAVESFARGVRITARAILAYLGIRDRGEDRRLRIQRVCEAMGRLGRFRVDGDLVAKEREKGADVHRRIRDDVLFKIVDTQERIEAGEVEDVEWILKPGTWAEEWLCPNVWWVARVSKALLELSSRATMAVHRLAFRIGAVLVLEATERKTERGKEREYFIRTILEKIGALPARDSWKIRQPGRLRAYFEEAIALLRSEGILADAETEYAPGSAPGRQSRGWVDPWLASKIRFIVGTPEDLRGPVRRLKRNPKAALVADVFARVREERDRLFISLANLARELGIPQPRLSELERGMRQPTADEREDAEAWLLSQSGKEPLPFKAARKRGKGRRRRSRA